MKKKFYFFLLLLVVQQVLFAQINDAQLWQNITLEKNITPKLSARIVEQGRSIENLSRPAFIYFDMGLNYKINKHLHATIAYVWNKKRKLDDFWSTRQQAYLDFTFRQKIKKSFLLCDRQMFQWQVKDVYTSATGHIPEYYLRNKVTIRYEKNYKVAPYLAEEIYYKVNEQTDNFSYHFNRLRCFAGVFFRPDLIDEFELYYLFEHHFNINNPPTNWVIGIGYTHSF